MSTAYCLIYGEIHFIPGRENELEEMAHRLKKLALEHRLYVNLQCAMTSDAYQYYPRKSGMYLEEGFVPYEILDSPLYSECSNLFNGIYRNAPDWTVCLENTRMSDLQVFLCEALEDSCIDYMTIDLYDQHGWPISETYEATIHADALIRTLESSSNRVNKFEVPAARLKILRRDASE